MPFLVAAIFLSSPCYLLLQVAMLALCKGPWRRASAAPLAVMGPAGAYAVVAGWAGSNIAPIVPVLLAPFALVALLLIGVASRASTGSFFGVSA